MCQEVFGQGGTDRLDQMARQTVHRIKLDESEISILVDAHSTKAADIDRGVLSHVRSQVKGCKEWFEKTEGATITAFINLFDDADMWVRRPQGWQERTKRTLDGGLGVDGLGKLNVTAKRKRRNVHMPVMNLQETIVRIPSQNDNERMWFALDVNTPAVPMPKANYATVLRSWRKWSVLNGSGRAGVAVDPGNELAISLASNEQNI